MAQQLSSAFTPAPHVTVLKDVMDVVTWFEQNGKSLVVASNKLFFLIEYYDITIVLLISMTPRVK